MTLESAEPPTVVFGFSPFEETDEKEARKRVTLYFLWRNANMKMNVRIRRRMGECKEMEKKEKNNVHPVTCEQCLLAVKVSNK